MSNMQNSEKINRIGDKIYGVKETIGRLGERGTISKLVKIFSNKERDKRVVLGAIDNDDVALLDVGKGYMLVTTTDTMTISTHKPIGATFRQFGWYAASANLSDLAAKGAEPIGMMFAFGIPNDFYIDDLLEVAKGIKDCTNRYKTSVVGGDTKYNREFTITGIALGRVRKNEFIP
ncbi:MAG: AIR synthase related protein, partial [Thermoplasmata archaeon]